MDGSAFNGPDEHARLRLAIDLLTDPEILREGVELARAEYEQKILPHLLLRETVSSTGHIGSLAPADASAVSALSEASKSRA